MNKFKLGAPSLTGKDANDLVAAVFKDAAFPLKLKVTNLAAHPLSFPEVSGLHLLPCTHGDEATVVVPVPNYDALQRLASSIEQVAELNGNAEMLEMSVFDPNETDSEVDAADLTDEDPKSESEGNDEGSDANADVSGLESKSEVETDSEVDAADTTTTTARKNHRK